MSACWICSFLINISLLNLLLLWFSCNFLCRTRVSRQLTAFLFNLLVGGLSFIPPRSQGGGNILINSSSNIYPMDCDPPSLISIQQPSVQMTLTPSSGIPSSGGSTSVSLNVINQRYLHQHIPSSRNTRYNGPLNLNYNNYTSLPIDLIAANPAGSGPSGVKVLPEPHLNSSSLIINSNTSFHHPVGTSGGRGGNASNNSNNNSTGDESMVCVQQSPVVIH